MHKGVTNERVRDTRMQLCKECATIVSLTQPKSSGVKVCKPARQLHACPAARKYDMSGMEASEAEKGCRWPVDRARLLPGAECKAHSIPQSSESSCGALQALQTYLMRCHRRLTRPERQTNQTIYSLWSVGYHEAALPTCCRLTPVQAEICKRAGEWFVRKY